MKINLFSGSRRLALAVAALASMLAIGYATFNEPYVSLNYTVAAPDAPFIRTSDECPNKSAKHFVTISESDKSPVFVVLCLLPMAFGEDGRELIPYKIDSNGLIWGAEEYSSEVLTYEKQLEQRFRLAYSDLDIYKAEKAKKYWKQWRETIQYLLIGLLIYWMFITIVGWIVRGFLGISIGKDFRPEDKRNNNPD